MSALVNMYDPCVIIISRKTREQLKEVARKSQRYTDIIDELISLKERGNKIE
jgi:hypothetical protein